MAETLILSDEQVNVIEASSHEGDILVVAGAGSGKTFTMTRRIIHLIEEGVAPEQILGLTFTNKAAAELSNRVSAQVLGNLRDSSGQSNQSLMFFKPEIATYDSLFQSIVRQYGLLVGFNQTTQPLSEAGARQLVTSVIEDNFDLLFSGSDDLGDFGTLVTQVLGLSNAISSSMIGSGCASVADATQRIRVWDQAFAERLGTAIGDQTIPQDEPKVPKPPEQKKRESDEDYERRLA